jgi:hypothetical protein
MKRFSFFLFILLLSKNSYTNPCKPLEDPWTATKLIAALGLTYIGCVFHQLNKNFQSRLVKTGDIESSHFSKNPLPTNKLVKRIQHIATFGTLMSGAAATLLIKSALDDISDCSLNK